MRIEQALHGYHHGHSLLESSDAMARDVRAALDHQTDRPDADIPENGIVRLYNLPGQMKAFTKTWPAPEMKRPGCVWSHTLMWPRSQFPSLIDLCDRFQRPSGDFSNYGQPVQIQPAPRPHNVDPVLLAALLHPTARPVWVIGADKTETLSKILSTVSALPALIASEIQVRSFYDRGNSSSDSWDITLVDCRPRTVPANVILLDCESTSSDSLVAASAQEIKRIGVPEILASIGEMRTARELTLFRRALSSRLLLDPQSILDELERLGPEASDLRACKHIALEAFVEREPGASLDWFLNVQNPGAWQSVLDDVAVGKSWRKIDPNILERVIGRAHQDVVLEELLAYADRNWIEQTAQASPRLAAALLGRQTKSPRMLLDGSLISILADAIIGPPQFPRGNPLSGRLLDVSLGGLTLMLLRAYYERHGPSALVEHFRQAASRKIPISHSGRRLLREHLDELLSAELDENAIEILISSTKSWSKLQPRRIASHPSLFVIHMRNDPSGTITKLFDAGCSVSPAFLPAGLVDYSRGVDDPDLFLRMVAILEGPLEERLRAIGASRAQLMAAFEYSGPTLDSLRSLLSDMGLGFEK